MLHFLIFFFSLLRPPRTPGAVAQAGVGVAAGVPRGRPDLPAGGGGGGASAPSPRDWLPLARRHPGRRQGAGVEEETH